MDGGRMDDGLMIIAGDGDRHLTSKLNKILKIHTFVLYRRHTSYKNSQRILLDELRGSPSHKSMQDTEDVSPSGLCLYGAVFGFQTPCGCRGLVNFTGWLNCFLHTCTNRSSRVGVAWAVGSRRAGRGGGESFTVSTLIQQDLSWPC